MKPLLIVNGRPLIVDLVHKSKTLGVERRIIVASPDNVGMICELLAAHKMLGERTHIVVQPEAVGPVDAVYRAMPVVVSDTVLLLCGDNHVPMADIDEGAKVYQLNISEGRTNTVMCTKKVRDGAEAVRFTRVSVTGSLIDGVPGGMHEGGHFVCWLGPVLMPTQPMRNLLRDHQKFSRLSELIGARGAVNTYAGNCLDIGVPEALPDYNDREVRT